MQNDKKKSTYTKGQNTSTTRVKWWKNPTYTMTIIWLQLKNDQSFVWHKITKISLHHKDDQNTQNDQNTLAHTKLSKYTYIIKMTIIPVYVQNDQHTLIHAKPKEPTHSKISFYLWNYQIPYVCSFSLGETG